VAYAQADSAQQKEAAAQRAEDSAAPEEIAKLRLGIGDEMDITVFGEPALSQHARIGTDGKIYLPLLGYILVAGLSVEDAQAVIANRLQEGEVLKHPQVAIYVKEYTSQAVSVIGEVGRPGAYPVVAAHSLLDVLLMAGGLSPKAGSSVSITHRDSPQEPVVVTIGRDLRPVDSAVQVLPGDVVQVLRGDFVYLLGGVGQPGGYLITEHQIKLLDLFVKAAGPVKGASLNKAKLIRKTPDGVKESPIQLKDIMAGKTPDVALQPDDVVYIPTGNDRAGMRTILTAAQYALIFRP
jgi:polysaccharide biosynthesis/export protein